MGVELTNDGAKIFLERFSNASATRSAVTKMRIGEAQTTPTVSSTSLTRQVPITGTEEVDSCDATTGWTAGTDTTGIAVNTVTFKTGTGSLTLAKTGTTGTVMSMSKTTTSRDFTSKDLWCRVYLTALSDLVSSGTAITVRFGSDSTNYYYKDLAIGSLAAGWNHLFFSSSDATGTAGSPVIGSSDYTEIRFNTDLAADTIAAGRIFVDIFELASTDDYVVGLASGYPTAPDNNLQNELRAEILDTYANGFNINAIAFTNTDGTPLYAIIGNFTAIGKTSNEQIVGVAKPRIRQKITL